MSKTKNILCFGDSLTWGWVPVANTLPTSRYDYEDRWTGVMASHLGHDYRVIEEGLSGRTTCVDDPSDDRLNGSKYLPAALATHLPVDVIIIMLGTNDTKSIFNQTPYEIAFGMSRLLGQVAASAGGVASIYPAPKPLIVAPPPLAKITSSFVDDLFKGGREKSIQLAQKYQDLADLAQVDFLNAGDVISTHGIDGIHFTKQNNHDLGKAIADQIESICQSK